MGVKKRYARTHKNKLLKELLDQATSSQNSLSVEIQEVIDVIKGEYLRTVRGWQGRQDSRMRATYNQPQPQPEIEWKVKIKPDFSVRIIFETRMIGPDGENSFLWYVIDRGAKFVMPTQSAPFPQRAADRTLNQGLDPGPFPGYTDNVTSLPAGWVVEREPTKWSSQIGESTKAKLAGKGYRVRYRITGESYKKS